VSMEYGVHGWIAFEDASKVVGNLEWWYM